MTIQDFANMINGSQYRDELTKQEVEIAKKHGFVAVFGSSDDIVEMEGAISDEFGVNKLFLRNGKVANDMFTDVPNDLLEKWEQDKTPYIKPIWCPNNPERYGMHSWEMYGVNLEHAKFDIYEDDELFCRGLVFDISSVA